MDSVKRKTGSVKPEDYEDEVFIQSLGPLSARLQEQFPAGRFDVKSVSQFAAQIQQLTEDALGIKSLPPRPFPKPPTSIFRDVTPDGSLHTVLSKFHQLMTGRGLKRVDFTNPYHRKQEMLALVVSELTKKGALEYPKVFISPACGPEVQSLSLMVTSLKGEIAASQDSPGVTHIVKPFGPSGDPDDGVQYMRNLGIKGQKAKVHWWYYPNSYDEYVTLDDAPEIIEPDKEPNGPWMVYIRWVKDSVKYNEWMNPIDYEVDDTPAKPQPQAPLPGSVKQGVQTTAQAKLAQPQHLVAAAGAMPASAVLPPRPVAVLLPEVAPNEAKELQPGLVQQRLVQPDARILNTAAPAITVGAATREAEVGEEAVTYTVPAYASWFDAELIHPREKAACSSWFKNDSQQSADYMSTRNAILDTYKANPQRLLDLEALRDLEKEPDAKAPLSEVWAFLNDWGIINFKARPAKPLPPDIGRQPPTTESQTRSDTKEDAESDAKLRESLQAAQRLFRSFPLPTVEDGHFAAAGRLKQDLDRPRKKRKREEEPHTAAPEHDYFHEERYFCHVMPGVECTELRYHCTKIPSIDICPKAFASGKFPLGCTSKDFIRIDRNTVTADSQAWSDQDTLLLLEGLELFKDNWADIAEHVGKSQVQCISHFLRLPLEDAILDEIELQEASSSLPDGPGSLPFATHGNPTMALIVFLGAVVGPEVAAAAAKTALEVLLDDSPEPMFSESIMKLSADGSVVKSLLGSAASASLAAAALKAKELGDQEERKIRELVKEAVESQVKLIKLQLKAFGSNETAVSQEYTTLKAQREALSGDRIAQQSSLARATAAQPSAPTFIPSSKPIAYTGSVPLQPAAAPNNLTGAHNMKPPSHAPPSQPIQL